MKRPIVIEFSGLPNSGKTTLLHNIDKICKENGIKALIMQEPAERTPNVIPKGSIEQALWISLETLQSCLEVGFHSDVELILQDRGFYNQLFWAEMYENQDAKYSKFIKEFANEMAKRYDIKPDYLYIVDIDVDESLRRRMATGKPVTFSKRDFLLDFKVKFNKFAEDISNKFYIDTTTLSENEVAQTVFKTISKF